MYEVLKTRHIREVFIKLDNAMYRYLKYSKNVCLLDTTVNNSYHTERILEFKKNKNVVKVSNNFLELKV